MSIILRDITGELEFSSAAWRSYELQCPKLMSDIVAKAQNLRGLTVINLNSTADGGGVAEMLKSQIPFERRLGLDSRWLVLENIKFSRKILNMLQGEAGVVTVGEKVAFAQIGQEASFPFLKLLKKLKADIIVIHDPQPLSLINYLPVELGKIVRLHSDLSTPNLSVINFLEKYLDGADKIVVSCAPYTASLPKTLRHKTLIIAPAIDVTTPKNKSMSLASARKILSKLGLDTKRPIVSQVSRFDPWKDPWGVIEAYDLAKKQIPNLQLVLAGLMVAKDDPGAQAVLTAVKKMIKGRKDVHLFYNPRQLKDVSNSDFIGALYTASDIVIQKSIREGFGLTISEAMWKSKAVVAGKTAGAEAQIENGRNGVLVTSVVQAGRTLIKLLKDKALRRRLGMAAHKTVEEKFLLPRLVDDHLKLYLLVLSEKKLITRLGGKVELSVR